MMGRFILSRIARALLTISLLVVVTFILTRTFADPARLMLPLDASAEDYLNLRRELGLDEPFLFQLGSFIADAARGDFGESFWQKVDALPLVLERMPATLLLGAGSILVALLVGLPLGMAAGVRPDSAIDKGVTWFSSVAVSVPDFWLAILLILLFAVELHWLPTSGYGGIEFLILPVASLALRPLGRSARIIRESVSEEMAKRYVITARSKGLSERQVLWRHVLNNVVPIALTVLAYDFVFIFTGYAAYVETVFDWPGVGKLTVDAVLHHDVNLVAAAVFLGGIVIAVVNNLLDVTHALIDRRVSL